MAGVDKLLSFPTSESLITNKNINIAKEQFTKAEISIIAGALEVYKGEIKKIWAKADKLDLNESINLKQTFLETEALREKVSNI